MSMSDAELDGKGGFSVSEPDPRRSDAREGRLLEDGVWEVPPTSSAVLWRYTLTRAASKLLYTAEGAPRDAKDEFISALARLLDRLEDEDLRIGLESGEIG